MDGRTEGLQHPNLTIHGVKQEYDLHLVQIQNVSGHAEGTKSLTRWNQVSSNRPRIITDDHLVGM